MLKLYDNRDSSNASKIRILLEELGLPYERVEVPLTDARPDWYRRIHPFGTVPCLIDDQVVVPESNTALRYLADREGRDDLYPTEAAARARVDVLLDALSLQLRPLLWDIERSVLYGDPMDPGAVSALRQGLQGWERLMANNGTCTGAFTIADCAAAGRMMNIDQLPIELSAFPRLARMLETTRARPSYGAAMDHERRGPK